MKIEIHNAELADAAMLSACLERIKRFYGPGRHFVQPLIWVTPPERDGMLDYGMKLPYDEGGHMVVHAIRRPGSTEIEFHS